MPNPTDKRKATILSFEKQCVSSQDPKFFVKAIMAAKCPKGVKKPHGKQIGGGGGEVLKLKCGSAACEYQYTGIGGGQVSDLTNSAKYKRGTPDKILNLRDWHEGSGYFQMKMKGDNMGVEMEGWIRPKLSGSYTFSTQSDDSSEVWVATQPSTKLGLVKVVELRGCCRKVLGRKKVAWRKGQSYYIRAFVKEGRGSEYGKVGMRLIGVREYFPIPIDMFVSPGAKSAPNDGKAHELKYVTSQVVQASASMKGYTTYRLLVKLKGDAHTLYTLIGSQKGPLLLPPAFQVKFHSISRI